MAKKPRKRKMLVDIPADYVAAFKKGRKKKKVGVKLPKIYRKSYEEYKNKTINIVNSFFEQELGIIIEWVKDVLNVKKKIRRTIAYLVFVFAGAVLVLFGIAYYLNCLCPQLACGLSFIIVGLIAMSIGLIYRKFA